MKAAKRLQRKYTTKPYLTNYSTVMSELETREIRDNILNGLNVAFQKLVQEKKKDDSELAFSEKGQVVKVKATEI